MRASQASDSTPQLTPNARSKLFQAWGAGRSVVSEDDKKEVSFTDIMTPPCVSCAALCSSNVPKRKAGWLKLCSIGVQSLRGQRQSTLILRRLISWSVTVSARFACSTAWCNFTGLCIYGTCCRPCAAVDDTFSILCGSKDSTDLRPTMKYKKDESCARNDHESIPQGPASFELGYF